MNSWISDAVRIFEENAARVAPSTSPEKYNLYNGLVALAQGVGQMSTEIQNLQNQLNHIQSRIDSQA